MTTTINASTSAGLVQTADTSGSLALQTANTTALTLDTSQNATFAGSVKTNTLTSASATALTLQSAGTTAITVDTSQQVGIGTTSPSTKLTVFGSTTTIGATNASAKFSDNTNSTLVISHPASTSGTVTLVGNNQIGFATSDGATTSERMRIDSNGRVNINSTVNLGGIVQVNGNIAPTASPSSYWGLDFGTSTSAGSYITLAYGATYDMAGGAGVLWVFEQSSSVGACQAICAYGGVTLVYNSGSYSTTVNTASKTNIYYNAGTGTYRIQNLSSSPTTYSYWIASMRVRQSA